MKKNPRPGPFTIGECVYGEFDETERSFAETHGYLILDARGEHLAIVGGADATYSERTEGAAIARLFAVAPDLYEALRILTERAWEQLPPGDKEQAALDKAQRVLAKAGQS